MNYSTKSRALTLGLAAVAGFSASSATWTPTVAPVSYTDQVFPSVADAMNGFLVPGFHVSNNGALAGATLTSVRYDLYLTVRDTAGPGLNVNVRLENTTGSPQIVQQLLVTGTLYLDVPGIAGPPELQLNGVWEDPQTVGILSRSMTGFEVVNQDFSVNAQSVNNISTDAGLFAAVSVPGSVAWDVYGESFSTLSQSGSGIQVNISPVGDYSLVVTYTYDLPSNEVPEASTWVALAPLAAFGVWSVRRRMQARSK